MLALDFDTTMVLSASADGTIRKWFFEDIGNGGVSIKEHILGPGENLHFLKEKYVVYNCHAHWWRRAPECTPALVSAWIVLAVITLFEVRVHSLQCYTAAGRYRCTIAELKEWNKIKDVKKLYLGQRIIVQKVVRIPLGMEEGTRPETPPEPPKPKPINSLVDITDPQVQASLAYLQSKGVKPEMYPHDTPWGRGGYRGQALGA